MSRSLKSLMDRLNPSTRSALEAAAGLCVSQSHYEIEIEHWLLKLLEVPDSDLRRICAATELEVPRITRELHRTVERFKTGSTRNPTLSPSLVKLTEEAWLVASLEFHTQAVRSGHLLLALLNDPALSRQLKDSASSLSGLTVDRLSGGFARMIAGSPEEPVASPGDHAAEADHATGTGSAPGSALETYTQDLTDQARQGKLDPIVGRDAEIRQVIDILMRRRQNNPILTGEAGVGKTAVVEGLACLIAAGEVPSPLRGVSIRSLDLGLLQAGAGVRGEFEKRLKTVIEEVKGSPGPIILFIDEAHTLIGAGGAAGQGDAANLLKPALARGELRTIAATTWSEYKKHIEGDPALTRRFQPVKVEEPDEARAISMLRSLSDRLAAHHQVLVLEEAVRDAVVLSNRYLTGRLLPDKAVSVLDTACARVRMSLCAMPPALEDVQRQLAAVDLERSALAREEAVGLDHARRREELVALRARLDAESVLLKQRWETEQRLVARLLELRSRLIEHSGSDTDEPVSVIEDLRRQQVGLEVELRQLQGEAPLVHPWVDGATVAEVISGWTGVPVGRMLKDELETVQHLEARLAERVIGQEHALEAIARRIRTARAGLDEPSRPIGVFLLAGPSGVGKTETALALADLLYGGERSLITINMSEFQEKHTASTLKGAPPSYVGYGEGGVLTEAVRRKPYSVVLLDEIEKGHPDVLKLFYRVFDKGVMEDSEGQEIDFRNTVILLTSNLGTDVLMEACRAGRERPDPNVLLERLRPSLLRHLEPALLGRLVVVPYYPLSDVQLEAITRLKLERIARRVAAQQRATLTYSDEVVQEIVNRCAEVDSGARNVDHILTRSLLPEISSAVLAHLAEGRAISRIEITRGPGGGFAYAIDASP